MKVKFGVSGEVFSLLGHSAESRFEAELRRHVEEVEEDPDWLYAWYLSSFPEALSLFTKDAINIAKERKYGVFGRINDIQYNPKKMIDWLNNVELDVLFFKYYSEEYWEGIDARSYWLPTSYDPSMYYPSGEPSAYDVAFMGTVSSDYPLRQLIDRRLPLLKEKYGWNVIHSSWYSSSPPFFLEPFRGVLSGLRKCVVHNFKQLRLPVLRPGLEDLSYLEKDPRYIVGKDYAEVLRRTRVFIFGTSIYKYPIGRIFFGLGSRSYILMNTPECARELGLVDGVNYVAIDEDTWEEKLVWVLDNEEERARIAENGHRLVVSRHTHKVRCKELLRVLESEMS